MTPEYLDCELHLTNYNQASLTTTADGREHPGRPALDEALFVKLRSIIDPKEYGTLLFDALLQPESDLLVGYREALAVADNQSKFLRFRLRVAATAPPILHTLRWELLHDPKKSITFGCSRNVVFSRYAAVPERPRPEVRETPRLLVALANPNDLADYSLPTMDPAAARADFEKALEPLASRMTWEFLDPPVTAARLSARLVGGDFHALHLQAHGILRPEFSSASLVLEQDDGQADFVDEAALSQVFEGARELRLVTLIACHGGTPSSEEPLSGLGPGLVRRGVPAVLAMSRPISFTTAATFCHCFYDNLGETGIVDRAANEARLQLSLSLRDSDEWGTPILFMRLRDGRLWEPTQRITPRRTFNPEVPWSNLLRQIRDDTFVPFLGPGLCRDLLPSAAEIAERWTATYDGFPLDGRTDLPAVAQFVEIKAGGRAPQDELPELLAYELLKRQEVPERGRYEDLKLSKVSDKIAEKIFADDSEPHRILASLPISLYVTTNFDGFMASALRWQGKTPTVEYCRWHKDLDDLPPCYHSLEGTPKEPLVFHVYGNDSDKNSLVLTEDDHLDFLRAITHVKERMPFPISSKLSENMLLFLGYDVRRLDCRVILRGIVRHLKNYSRDRIALLQIDPKEDQSPRAHELKDYMEKCCENLKVKFYWGSVHDFLRELRDRFQGHLRHDA